MRAVILPNTIPPKPPRRDTFNFLHEVRGARRARDVESLLIADTGRAMAEIGVSDEDGSIIAGMAEQIASLFKPR
jgi:hypothetical protein